MIINITIQYLHIKEKTSMEDNKKRRREKRKQKIHSKEFTHRQAT